MTNYDANYINNSNPNGIQKIKNKWEIVFQLFSITIIPCLEILFYVIENYLNHGGKLYFSDFAMCFVLKSDNHYQIWRFLSYALVHKDDNHLYGNVLIQLGAGFILNNKFGFKIIFISIAAIYGGAMSVFTFSEFKILSGGSGGTFGLLGLLSIYLYMKRRILLLLPVVFHLLYNVVNEICTPEEISNRYARLVFVSKYCQINLVVSNSGLVHLGGLISAIIFVGLMQIEWKFLLNKFNFCTKN